MEITKVRIGELKVDRAPNILRTYSLGSCVAVVIYDKKNKIAGMSHIMLPSTNSKVSINTIGKYADTAIFETVRILESKGSFRHSLTAFLVGGAEMFKVTNETMKIGKRNILACKDILRELKIPLVFEDIGGNFGRTVDFSISSGEINIISIKKDE